MLRWCSSCFLFFLMGINTFFVSVKEILLVISLVKELLVKVWFHNEWLVFQIFNNIFDILLKCFVFIKCLIDFILIRITKDSIITIILVTLNLYCLIALIHLLILSLSFFLFFILQMIIVIVLFNYLSLITTVGHSFLKSFRQNLYSLLPSSHHWSINYPLSLFFFIVLYYLESSKWVFRIPITYEFHFLTHWVVEVIRVISRYYFRESWFFYVVLALIFS